MHPAGASVLPDPSSDAMRQLGIPSGCQTSAAKHRRRTVIAHAGRSIRHLQPRQANLRIGANVEFVHATDQVDLLFKSQLLEQGINPGFGIPWGRLPLGPRQEKNQKE